MIFGNAGKKARDLGMKLNLRSVLENTAPADTIMFRLPEENFHTKSVLIVHPGEEAVFVRNGKIIANIRESGKHSLKTSNYPFLDSLRSVLTGGMDAYTCQVYFVRNTTSSAISWGTQLELRDPVWNIATKVGVGGSYRFHICDGALFLTSLFGSGYTVFTPDRIKDYFTSEILMAAKSTITQAIMRSGQEILGVEASLLAFSVAIQPYVSGELEKNGLTLDKFAIDHLAIIDSEQREYLEKKLSIAAAQRHMGEGWWQSELAEIFHEMAQNPNGGGTASMVGGIGTGVAMGGMMGQMLNSIPMAQPSFSGGGPHCTSCGTAVPAGSIFCPRCGAAVDAKPAPRVCPNCRNEVPAGSKFCNNCGARME